MCERPEDKVRREELEEWIGVAPERRKAGAVAVGAGTTGGNI